MNRNQIISSRIRQLQEDILFLSSLQEDLSKQLREYEQLLYRMNKTSDQFTTGPQQIPRSIADHIEVVLADGPMHITEIVHHLGAREINSDRQTISGVITRNVRRGMRFKRIAPGVYTLLCREDLE